MNFENIRRLLGDPRERIRYEFQQDRYIYIMFLIFIVIAIGLIISSRLTDPALLSIIFMNIILSLLIAFLAKKSYIRDFPEHRNIINQMINNNQVNDFVSFLEKRISITDLYEHINTRSFDNTLANLGFSGFFSLFLFFISKIYSDIEAIIWAIILFFYVLLACKIYKFCKPKEIEITINALNVVNKYNELTNQSSGPRHSHGR
jgi:hypothetical protein